jgi:hypothetical protein
MNYSRRVSATAAAAAGNYLFFDSDAAPLLNGFV